MIGLDKKFSAREPDLYRKIYQRHDKTQGTNTFKFFEVPIGNTKCVENEVSKKGSNAQVSLIVIG